jgi:6-phosphogluconolactonase
VAYVSLRGDGWVAVYDVDGQTGAWSLKQTVRARPSDEGFSSSAPMTVSPDRRRLDVAIRGAGLVVTFAIDDEGQLALLGTTDIGGNANFLVREQTGRWLLASYNPADKVAVHRIDEHGLVTPGAVHEVMTGRLPHSVLPDPSNRFLFVPHTQANAVYQLRFDAETGTLERNTPAVVTPPDGMWPRHLRFHPQLDVAYVINESHSSITAYHFDPEKGTLREFQNISTLPNDYEGRNTTADLHLTPDGSFLYGSNRGHDSIVAFLVDRSTGHLALVDWFETEARPRSFALDKTGRFLYVAGRGSNRVAAYAIDRETARLTRFATYEVGPEPTWIEVLALD